MRKKIGIKKFLKIIIMLVLLNEIIFSLVLPFYKRLNPPDVVREFNKEKALQDYDFFWETIEKRYPYFNIAQRKLKIYPKEIRLKYLQTINQMENIDIHSFYRIIKDCLNEFKYLSHLILFDDKIFFSYKKIADADHEFINALRDTPLFQAIYNQKSIDIYNYLKNESPLLRGYFNFQMSLNKNFKTKIIDEKTAYLEICSPSIINEKKDIKKLLEFYDYIEKIAIENLIIKMYALESGDSYWMNNIVSPNIDEKKTYKTKVFFLNDDFVKKFYSATTSQIYENLDNLEYYPKLNRDDLKTFGGYFELGIEINPMFDKKKFSGNIYLLTDRKVYSSVEAFAQFSKSSGFATLVGENTGGGGYNGGTPMATSMPNCGLIFFYTMGYGINDDGSSNVEFGTSPDYHSKEGDTPLYTCLMLIKNNHKFK